jgi:hypothetical protein
MTFLDVSPFNRKEMSDAYIKAFTYGAPTISYYCATNGISQDEMDCLMFLEDEVLELKDRFRPPANSANMAQAGGTDDNGAGRPKADIDELSDSGEQWQETQEGEN